MADTPGEVAKFLDENWHSWRKGTPPESHIIYTDSQGSCYIIEKEGRPGFLLVDGKPFYSQAWL